MKLTRYQALIVKYLEAEYGYSICEVLEHFRDMPLRFEDIAEIAGCSSNTLRKICEAVEFNDNIVAVVDKKKVHYPNATDLFKEFATTEAAVIHCRDKLGLTVEETQEKLGISKTTIWRHTPDWLKYTFNFKKERKQKSRIPASDHPWRR